MASSRRRRSSAARVCSSLTPSSAICAVYARIFRRYDPPRWFLPPSQLPATMSGDISMNSE